MSVISIDVPEQFSKGHKTETLERDAKFGFAVWEYLNGNLTLRETSKFLDISYRELLEKLWNRGIAIDALSSKEIASQADTLLNDLREP